MLARAGVAACLIAATQAGAGETRGLGAHVHGLGQLDIAVEGTGVAMEFAAPGADIVGFEHAPSTDEQRAAVAAALERLERPLAIFLLPAAAGCTVAEAEVALVGGGAEEHDHGHGHDHASTEEHDHGHGHDHASTEKHDHEHGHDHAAAEEHDHGHGHGHEGHADAGHSEFRARYMLACTAPAALGRVDFPYFEAFPNAEALEVRLVSDRGASAHRVERSAPALALDGLI